MFITFEGGEGSGKTTQITKLAEALLALGYFVQITREPGGTPIGDQIRSVLLNPQNLAMVPLTEMLLYQAARAQHLQEKIKPWVLDGQIVLCDRFNDSTLVYQGYARQLGLEILHELTKLVCGDFKPQLTFLLDIDAQTGLKRAKKRMENFVQKEDRFENEELAFHEQVREGFLDLAEKNPERIYLLDALKTPEELHQEILAITLEKIKHRLIEPVI